LRYTYDFRDKIKHYTSLIVALEMGARYTLTDNLDGSIEERKFEIITIWKYK
jgi:hypothetical protein